MALERRGRFYFGDCQADIRAELLRYSKANQCPAHHFADASCKCGHMRFRLAIDDSRAAASRICAACHAEHQIGGGPTALKENKVGECICPCGCSEFEITVGLSLHEGSENVKWIYFGCRCPHCGLTGVFGDWENDLIDYQKLLACV